MVAYTLNEGEALSESISFPVIKKQASDTAGLTAMPDVKTVKITGNHKRLLVCTDGVWEFIENDEAPKPASEVLVSSRSLTLL